MTILARKTGGKCDDGDDESGLRDWLRFYFEGRAEPAATEQNNRWARREECVKALA
jgi:hypothetical protein